MTTLLCILDGFGFNPNPRANAVYLSKKPNIDSLLSKSPWTTLITYGERVGLPEGQMGNSEVGHLNIGAGRVVEQWLLRISNGLKSDYLDKSASYKAFIDNKFPAIHLVGLLSEGGVHSSSSHLRLLIEKISKDYSGPINLHLFTDGRDTGTQQGIEQVKSLSSFLKACPKCKIASICGRFFAMDRDKRWERTKKAYDLLMDGVGVTAADPVSYLARSYESGITDEFIEPGVVSLAPIRPEDGVLFWNFREDRIRQIVRALAINDFDGFERKNILNKNNILTFTDYDHTFKIPYLFPLINIRNHLGETLSNLGKTQLRTAETEKYPHVTYFFNGGIENQYAGEERKMVPSPRDVKTYDQKPEMSANGICDIVVDAINSEKYDLIVVNFANCDMVGHTGNLDAAIKAVETVDGCVGRIMKALNTTNGQGLIIADHGNAEQMVHYHDGSPHTAHTKYPVPCIVLGDKFSKVILREEGALCDVAPTLLKMMKISQPLEMTGKSLF